MMGLSSECHIEICFFSPFLVWVGVIFFYFNFSNASRNQRALFAKNMMMPKCVTNYFE